MSEEVHTVRIERVFKAPIELVYRAWTEPEQVNQWMKCDAKATLKVEGWEARVGAETRCEMAMPGEEAKDEDENKDETEDEDENENKNKNKNRNRNEMNRYKKILKLCNIVIYYVPKMLRRNTDKPYTKKLENIPTNK